VEKMEKLMTAGLRDSSAEEMIYRQNRKKLNLRQKKRLKYLEYLGNVKRDRFRKAVKPFHMENK